MARNAGKLYVRPLNEVNASAENKIAAAIAYEALREHLTADGQVAFDVPAHIVTAVKP